MIIICFLSSLNLFVFVAKARMAAPAIIFFDEIDALAVEREGR